MAWIESHTVLIRHRKLISLARDLRLKPVYVLGHLHALWHAALEQQEDGDLSSWSDDLIAEFSNYQGDAPQYVSLLQKHGWLDDKMIHDWKDYAGRYLEAKYRTSDPERLKIIKEKHSQTKVRLKSDYRQTLDSPPNQPNQPNQTNQEKERRKEKESLRADALQILEFLNLKSKKNFEPVDSHLKLIMARLENGASAQKCKSIIAMKCRKWLGDPKTEEWLRPKTLFNKTNFDNYKGELVVSDE